MLVLRMPQLTAGQRTFLVENYFKTQSINEVISLFEERFSDRNPPSASTIWRNVNKYRQHGTSLNRNRGNREEKGRGERKRIIYIQAVNEQLQNNPHVSIIGNGVGLPKSTFNESRGLTCDGILTKFVLGTNLEKVISIEGVISVDGLLSSSEIPVSYEIL